MQATIEIDLGSLADEWEAVAFRIGDPGEHVFGWNGRPQKLTDPTCYPHLIIRRKWVFPQWLKVRWYAEAENGVAYCGDSVVAPQPCGKTWMMPGLREIPQWLDIPKIGGDWRQSLRENPNWRSDNGQKDT